VNIDLLQSAVSGIHETVRRPSFHHEDISRGCLANLLANNETWLAFLDQYDFIVLMPMQRGSPAWFGFNEEHRNSHIRLSGANEVVRAADQWQLIFANDMHLTSSKPDTLTCFISDSLATMD